MNRQTDSFTLSIRVQPRARRNTVVRDAAGNLKIHVTAPPEDGRANAAVIQAVAEYFAVKRRQVTILAGQTSRTKTVRVDGLRSPPPTPR